jgi:hypothetical protein
VPLKSGQGFLGLTGAMNSRVNDSRERGAGSLWWSSMRNHGADATGAGSLPVGFGVIALVTHSRPRRDVGPKIEQGFEVRTVADLTTG